MKTLKDTYKLINGVEIPKVGFGTWQLENGEEAYNATLSALKAGYRLIDTAYVYGNEESVGKAIKDSGIKREEIFIVTKLPAEIKDYKSAKETFNKSLKHLGVSYVDLYLIHAPWPWSNIHLDCAKGNVEVWRLFEEVYLEKKARAIGVSNFSYFDIKNLLKNCYIKPMVNQLQYFIGHTSNDLVKYLEDNKILVQAYSPIYKGELMNDKTILKMAEKYKKTIPQICIRYCIQKGTVPLPRSKNPEHIKSNADIDFIISKEDMDYLDSINNTISERYYC